MHDLPVAAGVARAFNVRRLPREARPVVSRWTPRRGELVVVWRDSGEALVTRVRDTGDSNGVAVVWLEGVSGFYARHCVRPATFHDSARVTVGDAHGEVTES